MLQKRHKRRINLHQIANVDCIVATHLKAQVETLIFESGSELVSEFDLVMGWNFDGTVRNP